MAIMSSSSQIGSFFMVRTKEPDWEGEREREGALTCCTAAGWGGSVRSERGKEKSYAAIYILHWFLSKVVSKCMQEPIPIALFLYFHGFGSL